MSEHQSPKPPRPAHQSSTALSSSHQTTANSPSNPSAAIADQRLQSQTQQSQIQMMQQSSPAPSISAPTDMENKTGLPDTLKQGIENLSGLSMDDVKVHYNSHQPAQLQAHAYAQGSEIHLGAGQEKHLPHEAWHVVQQKQGRVPATAQLKSRTYINDDSELEQEADKMGAKATQMGGHALHPNASINPPPLQQVAVTATASHQSPVQRQLNLEDAQRLFQLWQLLKSKLTLTSWTHQTIEQELINAARQSDTLKQALNYLIKRFNISPQQLSELQALVPVDSFVRQQNFREANSPLSGMLHAGILDRVISQTGLQSSGHYSPSDMFTSDDFNLHLYQRLHTSIQALLAFSNAMHPRTRGSEFQITDGLELLNSVGRMSMMLASGDYFPVEETRPLPLNWTSDRFLDMRADEFSRYPRGVREELESNLLSERNRLKQSPDDDVSTNDDHRFPYTLDLYTGDQRRTHIKNTGAVRLDFTTGTPEREEISDALPGGMSTNEDLSYENIVHHLNLMDPDTIRAHLNRAFHSMSTSDPFFRELAILLVGIEGTQNNMMTLHGPMVVDLANQGTLSWNQALFQDDSRRPTLESMPYFVYASDANQKGTIPRSGARGPMERQAEVVQNGRFNSQAVSSDLATTSLAQSNQSGKLSKSQKRNLTKQDKESLGYLVFKDVYMRRQFQLQELFLKQFFTPLFSQKVKDPRLLLDQFQKAMEYYLIHKFMGYQKNVSMIFDLWDTVRGDFMASALGKSSMLPKGTTMGNKNGAAMRLFHYLYSLSSSEFEWNNCLIIALAEQTGTNLTMQDIIEIRMRLKKYAGANVGEMLDLNATTLSIILGYFNCPNATVEVYTQSDDEATTSCSIGTGEKTIHIRYAHRHFTRF